MRNRARYKRAVRDQESWEIAITGHPFIKGSVVLFGDPGGPEYEIIEEYPERGSVRIKKKEG